MKTVAQAEAELRAAALKYAATYDVYSDAFRRNGDMDRFTKGANGNYPPLHPETESACKASNDAEREMCNAASALAAAVSAEQRAAAAMERRNETGCDCPRRDLEIGGRGHEAGCLDSIMESVSP